MSETNFLTYRGYPVEDLAAQCRVEEVAYLLWHGELPTDAELAVFMRRERASRRVYHSALSLLTKLPENCHPMDVLRTMVSYLGAEHPEEDNDAKAANYAKSLGMFAALPTIVAADLLQRLPRTADAPSARLISGLAYRLRSHPVRLAA